MQVSELQLELERTAMDDPGRIELLRRLAQLYRELHEPKHAAGVYEMLLQISGTDLPSMKILIELREQLRREGDLEIADGDAVDRPRIRFRFIDNSYARLHAMIRLINTF